ncbi:MAG: hypothetical protein K2X03_09580 [Bryobacteraceae bacterium]|nr:hypothetical protein [Bryobacteraceae bacterium]
MPRNRSKLRLPYEEPYHWPAILQFLSLRLFAGVECVIENAYQRFGDGWEVTVTHAPGHLEVTLDGPAPSDAAARVAHLFDVAAPIRQIEAHLSRDPLLRVARNPGLRLPGCWDAFELTVRAILGQQVSVKGAATLSARLVERFGPPTATALADADVGQIGLPAARAATIRGIAQAFLAGRVDLHDAASLEAVKGIGPWTAQYVLMRALHDADAFPASDLVLLKHTRHASPRVLVEAAESWRPYRAYAAMHIWRFDAAHSPM